MRRAAADVKESNHVPRENRELELVNYKGVAI
jgi:hypothetical protein